MLKHSHSFLCFEYTLILYGYICVYSIMLLNIPLFLFASVSQVQRCGILCANRHLEQRGNSE